MPEHSLALHIESRILMIRGHRVMLDADLAEVYGVSTKRLNEQVKRNWKRFPLRYMFQLTLQETTRLMRSHFATGSKRNVRYRPYVFTEHGAIMLASVLNTDIAINASIAVVDAFVHLRELLSTHKDLAQKLEELEKKYDAQFRAVFDAIRELMKPVRLSKPPPPTKISGFRNE
jgi:hypothetical protein